MIDKQKLKFISLGCAKAFVDSEILMGALKKTNYEITIKVENNSITTSLKTILNNFDIEDLYINEPPIDETIGKILVKKDYDI